MDARYKPRLHSVDNIIQTRILGGEVGDKQMYAPFMKRRWMSFSRR